jgi:hypothetical protein
MARIHLPAYPMLGGILIAIDRIAGQKPRRHGVSVQVIADPAGRLIWASATLPGSTDELAAARTHAIISRADQRKRDLKTEKVLTKLRCCPRRATAIGQAILELHHIENSTYAG